MNVRQSINAAIWTAVDVGYAMLGLVAAIFITLKWWLDEIQSLVLRHGGEK